jgi:precorrin-6B C5,15-methyltransferase / cobalt-precorrin-6B C5,C15-methyltransferase
MDAVTVVGIGADGWAGLPESSRLALSNAEVVLGSHRQLDLVPDISAERVELPTPLLPALSPVLAAYPGRELVVLASGDPMFFGIGSTLVRLLGVERVRVLPHPSSVSIAAARMGWPLEETEVVSIVGRPIELLQPLLQPGRRFFVLSADGSSPPAVAQWLTTAGFGPSSLTVLQQLGGPAERVTSGLADGGSFTGVDAVNVIAVECRNATGVRLTTVPGLPDDAFSHDGQLTRREQRAITVSSLAPAPGELLWDVGAGSGSVGIEWMRTHRTCRAIAIERDAERAERISRNALALGVPALHVVVGAAPDALVGLKAPAAVFIGGGATNDGVFETCWQALGTGGRLVVNAVTVESESLVAQWHSRHGGELIRIAISRAAPVGGYTAWRPAMPITQWTVVKP